MYEVVRYYGHLPNDYVKTAFEQRIDAEDYLYDWGFHYSTTYGKEDVYYDTDNHVGSIEQGEEGDNVPNRVYLVYVTDGFDNGLDSVWSSLESAQSYALRQNTSLGNEAPSNLYYVESEGEEVRS